MICGFKTMSMIKLYCMGHVDCMEDSMDRPAWFFLYIFYRDKDWRLEVLEYYRGHREARKRTAGGLVT